MAIQRDRILPGSETPQRNVVVTSQTEFSEPVVPMDLSVSASQLSGPLQLTTPSPTERTYFQIGEGDFRLAIRRQTDDALVGYLESSYTPGADVPPPKGVTKQDLVLLNPEVDNALASFSSNVFGTTGLLGDEAFASLKAETASKIAQVAADALEGASSKVILTADQTEVSGDLLVQGNYLKTGSKKIFHVGTFSGTTDASGFLAGITHGAGFTPSAVMLIKTNTLGNPNWWQYGTDSYTSTTFQGRFLQSTGAICATQAVSGTFICYP